MPKDDFSSNMKSPGGYGGSSSSGGSSGGMGGSKSSDKGYTVTNYNSGGNTKTVKGYTGDIKKSSRYQRDLPMSPGNASWKQMQAYKESARSSVGGGNKNGSVQPTAARPMVKKVRPAAKKPAAKKSPFNIAREKYLKGKSGTVSYSERMNDYANKMSKWYYKQQSIKGKSGRPDFAQRLRDAGWDD